MNAETMQAGRVGIRARSQAYSLIEVLIAGAIVAIGIAAAALMASALLNQEEYTGLAVRALNTQEQAAKLWQLGLDESSITNILPERCKSSNPPGANSMFLYFSNSPLAIPNVGSVERLNPLSIVFHSGTAANGTLIYQTNEITVIRPTNLFPR